MITLALFDDTYVALRNAWPHKDTIKSLAAYPDVQWNGEAKAWLIDVGLIDKLYTYLGDAIAPASVSFWCECPLYAPQPAAARRRTKQQIMADKKQQQAAAGRFGRMIVEMGKQ